LFNIKFYFKIEKKEVRKAFLILVSLFVPVFMMAQEVKKTEEVTTKTTKVKQKEIGLAFSGFESFGVTYKFGNSKGLWRLNSLVASIEGTKRSNDA
jgi:hypothetical protein